MIIIIIIIIITIIIIIIDGKRPEWLTQMPGKLAKCMTWDVTVTDTLAESYLSATSLPDVSAADATASRKELKYQ